MWDLFDEKPPLILRHPNLDELIVVNVARYGSHLIYWQAGNNDGSKPSPGGISRYSSMVIPTVTFEFDQRRNQWLVYGKSFPDWVFRFERMAPDDKVRWADDMAAAPTSAELMEEALRFINFNRFKQDG